MAKKTIKADRDEAIKLLRELRQAVIAEKVLTNRKYVGLALSISHLLDRYPADGGEKQP